MESGEEADWSSWYDIVTGSPGFTLGAGIVCGMVANLLLRFRPAVTPPIVRPLATLAAALGGPCKMVLVVRTDIGMGKGKVRTMINIMVIKGFWRTLQAAAQCAHAAVMCYKAAVRETPELVARWEQLGVTKVCLKMDSEEGLAVLAAAAREAGLVTGLVRDAGRTQLQPGTTTVLGIGPGPVDMVNQLTGHLKLY